MRRLSISLASLLALACNNNPPATDAGSGGVDAFTPSDTGGSPDTGGGDTGAANCPGGCTAPQICCPDALQYACVDPTGSGECPLPDLAIDQDRAESSARVVWHYFEATDCTVVEGCIDGSGWRRLLRFDTVTPNIGTGDFHMGVPTDHPELFEYSSCHMHYHFNGYANYTLLDSTGATAATGHKQAFCLEDFEPLPGTTAAAQYDCSNQGISRGWADTYGNYLDCQWIDVTDVDPGEYSLRIEINRDHTIPEVSYDNNTIDAMVTIPADGDPDPLAACASPLDGSRDCGWTNAGTFTCMAGTAVAVGCGGSCGVGSCHGDPILRVCPDDMPCSSHESLGYGDSECANSANDCPGAAFTCPASGQYTILVASYAAGDTASVCMPAAGAHL